MISSLRLERILSFRSLCKLGFTESSMQQERMAVSPKQRLGSRASEDAAAEGTNKSWSAGPVHQVELVTLRKVRKGS